MKTVLAVTAFSAFVVSGALQHAGVLPVTALGNASIAAIEKLLDLTVGEALACPGNSNGKGNSNSGNNGNGRGRGHR